jgi:hypothetical protein
VSRLGAQPRRTGLGGAASEFDGEPIRGFARHLSDAARVIKREQRNDAVEILRSISDWLERLSHEAPLNGLKARNALQPYILPKAET